MVSTRPILLLTLQPLISNNWVRQLYNNKVTNEVVRDSIGKPSHLLCLLMLINSLWYNASFKDKLPKFRIISVTRRLMHWEFQCKRQKTTAVSVSFSLLVKNRANTCCVRCQCYRPALNGEREHHTSAILGRQTFAGRLLCFQRLILKPLVHSLRPFQSTRDRTVRGNTHSQCDLRLVRHTSLHCNHFTA